MSTHKAIVTVAVRAPLEIMEVPTVQPVGREVRVKVQWTASTPLDLHQNDGGLLVKFPQILGDSVAGIVEEVGLRVRNLAVGDQAFGFCFAELKCGGQQEFVTVAETSLSKLSPNFSLQEAVTLPNNVVTVFHAVTKDLLLPLAWPCPQTPSPSHANTPILIWGGASSCGQYALQILSHWGYRNLLATASPSHHTYLRSLGAAHVFDYRDPEVSRHTMEAVEEQTPVIPFIFDCIGSKSGSLAGVAKIAQSGTRVAVLLPVILQDTTVDVAPEYSLEVQPHAQWVEGVQLRGVRTHFYMKVSCTVTEALNNN
ncbi:hypothetical protein MMC25_005327 [Agyrium rufum]|nr:hypothetical protein [Agyrium rufum]